MQRVLIFGAASAIARATARRYAAQQANLFLVARDAEKLAAIADDLRVRGASQVHHSVLDANDYPAHAAVLDTAFAALGGVDIVLIAHGTLGDQAASAADVNVTLRELNTNALSVIALLTPIANRMETQRSGTIAVIGSVAGDRGRQSNYVYGTAKAALATFLQGLRNRLHPAGVNVLTIKPGFVDTPMTAKFRKGALWATPDGVAAGIEKAIALRRQVVYLPFFWRWIMLIIRSIPERIFVRLKL